MFPVQDIFLSLVSVKIQWLISGVGASSRIVVGGREKCEL